MPFWWKYDDALLVNAATKGLFGWLPHREGALRDEALRVIERATIVEQGGIPNDVSAGARIFPCLIMGVGLATTGVVEITN